jgi:hypothetical protein
MLQVIIHKNDKIYLYIIKRELNVIPNTHDE